MSLSIISGTQKAAATTVTPKTHIYHQSQQNTATYRQIPDLPRKVPYLPHKINVDVKV